MVRALTVVAERIHDSSGVALAAIKGLNEVVEEKDKELSDLKNTMKQKEGDIAALRDELGELKAAHAELKSLLFTLVSEKPVAMAD